MPQFSYVTTDFRGGVWSKTSQGRTTDDRYKTALNAAVNATATEQGAWQRRPGLRLISITRYGRKAQLRPFRFSREESYQMEFTTQKARFIVGLDLVRDETSEPEVTRISEDTPALVTLDAMPGGWAAGDTVIFNVNTSSTTEQVTTYALFGRQFRVGTITGNKFELLDAVTGDDIDGSTINWIPRTNLDTVQRVLEVTTPYAEAHLPYVRMVNTSDEVIVLCRPPNSLGYPPYVLRESGVSQFTFTEAVFVDGPFLDQPFDLIKSFINDLTLSGITGSVTVTADSTTGINDGDGFQTTDVGRQIWLQTGPPSWSGATTYAKEFKVLGSDSNIYKSVAGGNLNHDPTTDTGTYWEITSDTVVCTYGTITARSSTTVVTMTIEGNDANSVAPTRHWRLGVFSDTTGYPSCGCLHEDRLILAGALKNRFDGSRNFRSLTFSPTEVDGTVSDDNAVAAVLSNKDAELISWTVSGDDGLFIGSLAGEWKVSASNLDDPITPTSIQARNITTVGSAVIEPIYVYGAPYAVQAAARKLVAHQKNYYGKYDPMNLSERAEGLMNPSIADIAWVQEPLCSFFIRRSDGSLVSCIHKKAVNQEEYTGWFEHEHALGRIIESLSYGPNFSGTSDSLYVTTWDEDDSNPRWIETMMPVFTTGGPVWAAWHTDASSSGYYVRRMILDNGDSFDGIRVYLSWYLNGTTVHPYIGGLDLGNFVVADGYIDIPYTTIFTLDFLTALNDGTDYDEWGVSLTWADAATTEPAAVPANAIAVMDDPATGLDAGARTLYDVGAGGYGHIYRFYADAGDIDNRNIQVFRMDTGEQLDFIDTRSSIFNGAPGSKDLEIGTSFGDSTDMVSPDAQLPDGGFFGLTEVVSFSDTAVSLFDRADLQEFWFSTTGLGLNRPVQTLCCRWVHDTAPANWNAGTYYDTGDEVFGPDGKVYSSDVTDNLNHNPAEVGSVYWTLETMPALVNNFAVMAQQAGGSGNNEMTVMNLTPTPDGHWNRAMGYIINTNSASGYPIRLFYRGIEAPGSTMFYEIRWNDAVPNDATDIALIKWTMTSTAGLPSVAAAGVRGFSPSSDFGFSDGCRNFYVMTDLTDSNPILLTTEYPSGVTRILKVHRNTGTTIWNVEAPEQVPETFMPSKQQPILSNERWHYMSNTQVVYQLDTTDGTITVVPLITTGFSSYGGSILYDETGPSLLFKANFNDIGGETYIGPWAIANEPSWTSPANQNNRLWLGVGEMQDQDHRELSGELWFIPMNVGVSFTSTGQLVRPDYGLDGGQRAGPAFGKRRRNHWYAMNIDNGYNISIGVNFTLMYPVKLQSAGGIAVAAPALFSGIASDTLTDDYTWDGMIAWRVQRQYPCTIMSLGGYISTQDK